MTFDLLPQVAAAVVAGVASVTDALRGKIYNKVVVFGLGLTIAWLATLGGLTWAGGDTILVRYPELGHFGEPPVAEVAVVAAAGHAGTGTGMDRAGTGSGSGSGTGSGTGGKGRLMPWEETPGQSVWPPVPTHGPVDVEVTQSWTEEDDAAQTAYDARTPDALGAPVWTEPGSFWIYVAKVALNVALAFAIGFGLWWVRMWAAGDAKLFGTLAALLPLSTYSKAYWPIFPAYVLIFNTFVAMLLILVAELALRGARQVARPTPDEADAWRQAWAWCKSHWRDLAIGFVGLLFLFLVIKTLRMVLRVGLALFAEGADDVTSILPNEVLAAPLHFLVYLLGSNVVVYFLLLLVFHPFSQWMRRKPRYGKMVVYATLAFVAYVAFFPFGEFTLAEILAMSSLMLALVFGLIVYQLYVNVFDFRAVRVWELRPRMILSPKTLDVLKEDIDLLEHKMGPIGPDGIEKDQVDVLRRWWIDRGKGGRIWVSRTIPFAPALFAGTVVTVLLGGYLVRV